MTGQVTAAVHVGMGVLVAAQTALIVALIVQRRRRRQTGDRHDAMLRGFPDLVFLQSRDGIYLDYSARDPKQLIWPPSQFLGRDMREVLPTPIVEAVESNLPRLFAGEDSILSECSVPAPSGEVRRLEARLARCDDDKFVTIIRDITDRQRATDAVMAAQAEYLRATRDATLGEFASAMAHELAQPLTAIIANSHACLRLLEQPSIDVDELRDGLRDVLASGKRARDVINHTRHLFSAGALENGPVDLAEIVNEVSVLLYSVLEAKHIAVKLHCERDLPTIYGDRQQLRQVVLNLASNSIQAMEQADGARPRQLTMSARRDGASGVRVTVADTGADAVALDLSRLFSVSYTANPNGLGWGLTISRSIVEAHGGHLWAESDPPSMSFRLRSSHPNQ